MRTTLAIVALIAGATGCETDDNHAEAVCAALCDCSTGTPTRRQVCFDGCMQDLPSTLPAGCTECVLGASCVQLAADACDDICDGDRNEDTPSFSALLEEDVR